jgi:hypothetical protein
MKNNKKGNTVTVSQSVSYWIMSSTVRNVKLFILKVHTQFFANVNMFVIQKVTSSGYHFILY